jgi:tyrosyl-tRNA synthetase
MSQSLGNYVGIDEPPEEMFGKLMRVPDELIVKYLRLCTGLPETEIDRIELGLADGSIHPNEEKRRMARSVVALYHGEEAARRAEERFDRVFRAHELPDQILEVPFPPAWREESDIPVATLLDLLELVGSRSEARRLIKQGGVRVDGTPVTDPEWKIPVDRLPGTIWQVGRRKFVKIAAQN